MQAVVNHVPFVVVLSAEAIVLHFRIWILCTVVPSADFSRPDGPLVRSRERGSVILQPYPLKAGALDPLCKLCHDD